MKIYNTLTRRKEEFVPIKEGEASIYACGPTVYNYFHIGNARPFVVFDTLRKYLEYRGNKVTFVQNFTDIDDKMINKANQEGISVKELAERFIGEYYKDADALKIGRAMFNPKATEHIPEIIALVKALEDKGFAYESNGDVYFSAKKFPEYGKLSGQPLENLEAGARIDPGESKRDAMDFALWKAAKPNEPSWESPWGLGRPGWHIECSAMSMKYLGSTFDIHGGGADLIFPHHENEIAQSECATGAPFARYWMHNGYINVDNQKMSKSLNNFFTVRDISEQYDLEVVRLFLLSAHYRNPINFSQELMRQTQTALERLYTAKFAWANLAENAEEERQYDDAEFIAAIEYSKDRFIDAMDDDLNTADAIGALFELVRAGNANLLPYGSKTKARAALGLLTELSGVLGLLDKEEQAIPAEITRLAQERAEARTSKDFARADALRAEIAEKGYLLEDTPQGFVLKPAK